MGTITSKSNPIIIETAKLKSLKHRKEVGSFLIEGIKVIEMALCSGYKILRVFYEKDKCESFSSIIKKAEKHGAECVSVTEDVAAKLSFGKTTQGIFAVAKINKYSLKDTDGKLVLALEELKDPGNMGTIIRTADAVGVKSIIIGPNSVDIYNDKVIRASMGSVFNMNIISVADFIKSISEIKEKGYRIACGHLDGGDFFARSKANKNVLIIGNEARGISSEAANECDVKWKLPMRGGAESLNAAVAAGIMMYDLVIKE